MTIVPLENGEFCFPPTPPPPEEPQEARPEPNANNNDNAAAGRRGRRPRNNAGSDENINSGEGSPTTRFIQQLFIPSMANWEASHNAHNANVVATASRVSTTTLNSATPVPDDCGVNMNGVNMSEELQLQLLLEEHHRLVRDNPEEQDDKPT